MFFAAAYELLPAKANSYQNPNANTITNANTNTNTNANTNTKTNTNTSTILGFNCILFVTTHLMLPAKHLTNKSAKANSYQD